MARDDWNERLEAYLDGELAPEEAAAFAAATAADPARQDELEARRRFRAAARDALGDEPALDVAALVRGAAAAPAPVGERTGPRWRRRAWPALALAAVLAVAVLGPRLLRNVPGAAGPRSTTIRAGQVTAVGYGEEPGRTVTLQTGVYDQRTGKVH